MDVVHVPSLVATPVLPVPTDVAEQLTGAEAVTVLDGDYPRLTTTQAIAALGAAVPAPTGNVAALSARLSALEARVATAEARVATLVAAVASAPVPHGTHEAEAKSKPKK